MTSNVPAPGHPPVTGSAPAPRSTRREQLGQIVRFALVGGVNTVTFFGIYLLLHPWMPYFAAYTLAFLLSMVGSFFMNTYFTYRTRPTWKKFALFPLTNITNYVIQSVGLFALVQWAAWTTGSPRSWRPSWPSRSPSCCPARSWSRRRGRGGSRAGPRSVHPLKPARGPEGPPRRLSSRHLRQGAGNIRQGARGQTCQRLGRASWTPAGSWSRSAPPP